MSKKAIIAKEAKVNEVVTDLQKAKSFIVFEYHGLTAKSIAALRKELHDAGSKLYVLQNNILRRALKVAKLEGVEDKIVGPNAIAIAFEDEINPIKAVNNVAEEYEVVQLKTAFLEGNFMDASMIKEIANIPGRDGLLSMFLSCLSSPIRGFMYALKAVSETKEN